MRLTLTHSRFAVLQAAGLALAMVLPSALHAQPAADPPSRVTRIAHAEGSVRWLGADGSEAAAQSPQAQNRPLVPGDRVQLDRGARAELESGDFSVRLQGPALLYVGATDDQATQLRLVEGTLAVRMHLLQPGERFEVGTPNLAAVASSTGAWRLDIDPALGTTRVAVGAGTLSVYGENGQAQALRVGPPVAFSARALAPATSPLPNADAFDQWVALREQAAAGSTALRWLPGDMPGAQQLEAHGEWQVDPHYGNVWLPANLPPDWAPYRQGHWAQIAPWGWTWIDDAPWGFAPFHYGRWAQRGPRWAWVPGPRLPRPVYAPALVGFAGGAGGTVSLSSGGTGVAWFPLAPGEAWRPAAPFGASYTTRVNRGISGFNVRSGQEVLLYQRHPHAVTAWRADQFGLRGVRPPPLRLAERELAGNRTVPPPQSVGLPPGLIAPPAGRVWPPVQDMGRPPSRYDRHDDYSPPVQQRQDIQDRAWQREVRRERQGDAELLQRNPRTEPERARREQLQRQQQQTGQPPQQQAVPLGGLPQAQPQQPGFGRPPMRVIP